MQWTSDANAGFSSSTTLVMPVNEDTVHGYRAVNVEAQRRNPSSLLNWTRRMVHRRRAIPSFGLGDYQDLGGSNPAVLAYARRYVDQVVVCVNNLSRTPQATTDLDLAAWADHEVVELTGGTDFPRIEHAPYRVTLGPHGFYWLGVTLR